VNQIHFDRIEGLRVDAVTRGARILGEVKSDRQSKFISPLILTGVARDSKMMEEEIFGPLLPIIFFDALQEAITYINEKPKPLALYVFTTQKTISQKVLRETSAGTMCINDCGVQFLHHNLPFGGVNNSGIGKTHGHSGFLAFSNEKPVLKQKSGLTSVQAFYPPYTSRSKKLMDWFLKFF
jgi:aldehyde dehydrogenase (NAD+)